MKIAHVVDSMEMGGAETLVSQMCRLQRELGHTPCVYALAALGPLGEVLRKEGFSVEPNVGSHLTDSTRSFLRIFKESHPDVAHMHNPTPTIYAAVAARCAGVPSVVSTRHSLVAPPHDRVAEFKYAIASRFCDWIVGVSGATVDNLKGMHSIPRRKIVRVYNGAVPLSRVPEQAWPLKSSFTFLYVGRLEPVKNHALLLNAFAAALTTMPELRLWMVGDGSQRPILESLTKELGIGDSVTFWGQQLDVAPFFSAADTFIMSSKSEGLPVSLLQAFSVGLPAIVTDVGGMAEVVRTADAGLTVSVSDPAEMTSAIVRMAASDSLREQFARNGDKAFAEHFTLKAMVATYLDLYGKAPRVIHPG
jgi:L-malate glycosyltransferase